MFRLHAPGSAGAVAGSLQVEAADPPPDCTIRVDADDDEVAIEIEAETISGLRAALHGMVRLAAAARASLSDAASAMSGGDKPA